MGSRVQIRRVDSHEPRSSIFSLVRTLEKTRTYDSEVEVISDFLLKPSTMQKALSSEFQRYYKFLLKILSNLYCEYVIEMHKTWDSFMCFR